MHCRFDDDLKMIKRKGTIVTFESVSGPVEPVKLFRLTEKKSGSLILRGFRMFSKCCLLTYTRAT